MFRLSLLAVLVLVWSAAAQDDGYPKYWARRTATLFAEFDDNEDKKLTESEFDKLAEESVTGNGLKGDAAALLRVKYSKLWKLLEKNNKGKGDITAATFSDILKSIGKDYFLDSIYDFYLVYYPLIDVNNDAEVSLEEFTKYYHPLGLDIASAAKAFKLLDKDKDDIIRDFELLVTVTDYYVNADEKSADTPFILSILTSVAEKPKIPEPKIPY